MFLKWFVSETPYLIHDTTKAPHITGSGVLLVVDGQMRGTHTKHDDHSCHMLQLKLYSIYYMPLESKFADLANLVLGN